ncbi:hypothetical protein FISHEDRAFT_51821 [Fistulina hepatica ATCC 64428]|nr:hypothetical protein FISHEDRAFT_51821 [Fistulina hepatica ATCC 64428]
MSARPGKRHAAELTDDGDERSTKRQRTSATTTATARAPVDASPKPEDVPNMLLCMPAAFIKPPGHEERASSLCASLFAIRKCIALPDLAPDEECRAWTTLAELGLIIIKDGYCADGSIHKWAHGVLEEVEKAISKSLVISQKHPALRLYYPHASILSVRLAVLQGNMKFARNAFRKLLFSKALSYPHYPHHIVYSMHLEYIDSLTIHPAPGAVAPNPGRSRLTPGKHKAQASNIPDVRNTLNALQKLADLASSYGHSDIILLCDFIKLRLYARNGMWNENVAIDAKQFPVQTTPTQDTKPVVPTFGNHFHAVYALHVLVLSITYHTYSSGAKDIVGERLERLHAILDSGVFDESDAYPDRHPHWRAGTVQPLVVTLTHPKTILTLAYLVSSIAKHDPVGRNPKKKIFAEEGVRAVEREIRLMVLAGSGIAIFPWTSAPDATNTSLRLAKIKAELLCELASVAITRSEHKVAEDHIATLIAHTRSYKLFDWYAPRITLLHAHLAHSQAGLEFAIAAARTTVGAPLKSSEREPWTALLAQDASDKWLSIAARAGLFGLSIGRLSPEAEQSRKAFEAGLDRLRIEGAPLVRECQGLGGKLAAVGRMLEACLSTEVITSKQLLRQSLNYTTASQDNYLRGLVLAMCSNHYLLTAEDHARGMLESCANLAAGLGAQPRKRKDADRKALGSQLHDLGNIPLRMWVGDRLLELYSRADERDKAAKHAATIKAVNKVIVSITDKR